MTDRLDTREQWYAYRTALKDDAGIGVLKEFRDRLICDQGFSRAFNDDPKTVLNNNYEALTTRDVSLFLSQPVQERLGAIGDFSDRALLLRRTLDLDHFQRKHIKLLHPAHSGWDVWRQLQITRYQQEDPSPRGVQITHIPFAIELTQGCSGACAFCGLSAPPLSDHGHDLTALADPFRRLLKELHGHCGELGPYGVLYWASDPLDHPHYEAYADLFADEFGTWPGTTTALAETQLDRVRQIIDSDAMERPWGLRCSLRSASAYRQICHGLSVQERAQLRLLPQYKQSSSILAAAGRSFNPDTNPRQMEVGGTIACMSGLLISLSRLDIQLITPCRAERQNRNGYRVLASTQVSLADHLVDGVPHVLRNLPCPTIHPQQLLRVNIDSSQFPLYSSDLFPDLLVRLNEQPSSIAELCQQVIPSVDHHQLITHCLALMQVGALRAD
jgi:hypothetical protein